MKINKAIEIFKEKEEENKKIIKDENFISNM